MKLEEKPKITEIELCKSNKCGFDCKTLLHAKISKGFVKTRTENANIFIKICEYNNNCKFKENCKDLHMKVKDNFLIIQETNCDVSSLMKTSAGILPYARNDNKIYVLLGKERGKNDKTILTGSIIN
jgi:hypothetical protein